MVVVMRLYKRLDHGLLSAGEFVRELERQGVTVTSALLAALRKSTLPTFSNVVVALGISDYDPDVIRRTGQMPSESDGKVRLLGKPSPDSYPAWPPPDSLHPPQRPHRRQQRCPAYVENSADPPPRRPCYVTPACRSTLFGPIVEGPVEDPALLRRPRLRVSAPGPNDEPSQQAGHTRAPGEPGWVHQHRVPAAVEPPRWATGLRAVEDGATLHDPAVVRTAGLHRRRRLFIEHDPTQPGRPLPYVISSTELSSTTTDCDERVLAAGSGRSAMSGRRRRRRWSPRSRRTSRLCTRVYAPSSDRPVPPNTVLLLLEAALVERSRSLGRSRR